MTEKEIVSLGFTKEYIDSYEGDDEYYYVLDIVKGLTFITQTNKETTGNKWCVDFFDTYPNVRFTNFFELQGLINTLTKHIVKNDK